MLVRIWRLLTIMFAALAMGVALCHALEMPAKLSYDPATWLKLLQTLYPPDWTTLRDRWEYTHTARAILQAAALGFLVLSILVETPPLVTSMKGNRRG
jgi:hypothetical protein